MNLKKFGKVFTGKFVETGPSSYKKNYRAAVSQCLRNTALELLSLLNILFSLYTADEFTNSI